MEQFSKMNNTEVKYMYRDCSNYKFHRKFVVQGELKASDIKKYLHDKEFFIPHEIGLDHLLNLPMNQDDHYLHTFEGFISTEDKNYICSAKEFIDKLKKADKDGWFSSFNRP